MGGVEDKEQLDEVDWLGSYELFIGSGTYYRTFEVMVCFMSWV